MMSLPAGRRSIPRVFQRHVASRRVRQFSSTHQQKQATYPPSRREPIRNQARRPFQPHFENRNPPRHIITLPLGPRSEVNASSLLLRDLCSCPVCVDPSTKQKNFSTSDIPANVQARSVNETADKVQLQWANDIPGYDQNHTTELPKHMLRKLFTNGSMDHTQGPIERAMWDARMYQSDTSDFSYEAYMKDDTVLLQALRQLHTHGLLFVTDVPEDEKSVETVAERIGPLKTTFYGRTWDVRSVPDAINVAYTSQNLGFHMDLMYMHQPPHLQLLHCIRSSAAGGASLFTDSFRAVVDLAEEDEDALHQLTLKRVNFHYDHPGSQYYQQYRSVIEQRPIRHGNVKFPTWRDLQRSKSMGNFEWLPEYTPKDFIGSVSWSPPFQGPFGLKTPAQNKDMAGRVLGQLLQDWHPAAQKFDRLIHREEMIYERMMRPGECVIFDNRRVLHARRAFEVGDAGKERWLRGAYIDEDPYKSRLKVLRDELERGDEALESSSTRNNWERANA